MSAGLPFVWPAAVWQESYGRYRGRDLQGHQPAFAQHRPRGLQVVRLDEAVLGAALGVQCFVTERGHVSPV